MRHQRGVFVPWKGCVNNGRRHTWVAALRKPSLRCMHGIKGFVRAGVLLHIGVGNRWHYGMWESWIAGRDASFPEEYILSASKRLLGRQPCWVFTTPPVHRSQEANRGCTGSQVIRSSCLSRPKRHPELQELET